MSADHPNRSNPPKLSALAVASVILGLLGFITLWIVGGLLLAGAGAVLGHMALHDIRFSNGRHKGKRVARVGLVICYLAMVMFPILGAGAMASFPVLKEFQKSQIAAMTETSQKNASRLFIACEQYSRAHDGKYPRKWNQLAGGYLSLPEIKSLLTSPYPNATTEAFQLVPHERPILPAVASSVVVIQEIAPVGIEKVAIVHADGTVSMTGNPNR